MDVLQQLINGLSLGALYALIAVGYTVVYGIIQLINFAHGEIFMIGAFGAFATWFVVPGASTSLVLLPIMLIGGMAAAVGVALLTERFAYRPLRNAPRLAPLITAIGVSVFLQEAVRLFFGRLPGFPDSKRAIPFPQIDFVTGPAIQIGELTIQRAALFTLVMLAVCTVFLYFFVNKSRLGRAMQATSQDPDTARLMGINVDRIIMVAFAVGAALAAVAGLAYGLRYTNIDFKMGFLAGLKAFTAAVLGG
ncbi:MAG TPA: branched-chain amino acid ABC transporter permease, partial [Microlunatus sp.]|nr:branched-chain amino acid ABC transporter permease [Microlunatus sp.]